MSIDIITLAGERGVILDEDRLAAAGAVHCQLRPHLQGRYVTTMKRVFQGGAEMCVAADGVNIRGLAVYRLYENTSQGRHLYIDDLVTDEAQRSRGVGRALLEHLAGVARQRGCVAVLLDSGTHRNRAHAFYFREGYTINAFHFVTRL